MQTETFVKEDLYDKLFQTVGVKKGDLQMKVPSFYKWASGSNLLIGRKQFTWDKHEYLRLPYRDDHPFTVEMKAVQMGLTTKAMLKVIYRARFKKYEGILYFFPSRTDVSDLSRARFGPLAKNNPEEIGNFVADTDQTNLKMIANTPVYFRGMKSAIAVQSAPGDVIIFDELDLATQSMVDVAMDRLDHAEGGGEITMLSKPSMPDYGIHRAFLQTDQRYWLLKCSRCRESHNLVDEFPNCFVRKKTGDVIRACVKCGKELNPAKGEWVAKKPQITDKRGYQFSQLYSQYPRAAPAELLKKFEETRYMKNFYNQKIGIPYIEAENRLSEEQVLALCGSEPILSYDKGPCSMGVDQGKDLHVIIGKRTENYKGKIVHVGIYKDWKELDSLMSNFNVSRCVVDAMPETRNAREFSNRFQGRIFLGYYRDFQKGEPRWDEQELQVSCNRTESLDASHNEFLFNEILLPKRCDMLEIFAKHMHNVGKDYKEDEETGSKRAVYVKLGEDHFRHSFNYEVMARHYVADLMFPELQ